MVANHFPFHGGFIPDDFPTSRPGGPDGTDGPQGKPLSEWGMLARGKTLGKKCIIVASNTEDRPIDALVNILEIKGEDEYALQLNVTISPPRIIDGPPPDNEQNASGSVGNVDIWTQNHAVITPSGYDPLFPNPIVELQWGIGGTQVTALADISNGLSVNLNASFLRIRANIENNALGQADETTTYELAAFVGPRTPRGIPATRTQLLFSLADGSTTEIPWPVPNLARRVYVIGVVAGSGVFLGKIRFFRDLGLTLPVGELFFNTNQPLSGPIPNGAYYYTVTNYSGAVSQQVQAIFELAL